ncbi:MAG: exonuclease SbcCD subunit D [Actinobacteria bacterium]|nr:MAG: exonuclease SbcCD subunit D [Actinomycetota bacterium]RIK04568.1 MAG: DNA exonuclease SbcCD subunit SbcD [Acidobacteriota bacterium]
MRLLHVSDWHLGATLGRVRRRPDHERVLGEIVAVCADFSPDLVLHTGDLFDHPRPATEDLSLGIETLRRLSERAPVVVLAGNHDSAALFGIFDRLLDLGSGGKAKPVRFIPKARPAAKGGIVDFTSSDGERIRLAPVPFIHPNTLMEVFGVPPERWKADYTDQVRYVEENLGAGLSEGYDPSRDVLLFAAHLHVGGATFSGSERPLHITDTFATRTEHLPQVSYAAFGHIHKPQSLPGTVPGEYAGSPIAIDFGERDEVKSVVCVEASPGAAASIERVELSGGRPLVRLEGSLGELERHRHEVGDAILQVICCTDEHVPQLADQVTELFPEADIYDIAERCSAALVEVVTDTGEADAEPPLGDLFREYLATEETPAPAVDRAMRVFDDLLGAAEAETEAAFDEEVLFDLATVGKAAS